MNAIRSLVARALLMLIAGYHLIVSPWLPQSCRFAPSCSAYAAEAIALHGPWVGTRLAIARIARCHPWHPGGHDPVPDPHENVHDDARNPRGRTSPPHFESQ